MTKALLLLPHDYFSHLRNMKIFFSLILPFLVFFFSLASCNQRKPAEITTEAEQITTADTTPIVASQDSIDSTSLDPQTQETALQQDPPPSKPTKTGECNPGFILLSNPSKNHHIFQVTGFDATNFKCWHDIEKHGIQLCGNNMPCEISYLEVSAITKTSNPPYHVDATQLKNHGIGHFVFKNSWWELRGANIWKRTGKGYEYYNSNRY